MQENKHYEGIKTLEILEGANNYNAWIANSIKPYIVSPALEIGAGTGNISSFFKEIEELVVTDSDSLLVSFLRDRFKENKNVTAEEFDIGKKMEKIPKLYQTVYSVNVLEHIKNDSMALENMYRLLKKRGRVVLLVPAKKIAHTRLDDNLGHFRRYEKAEIKDKLENAHFKIEMIEYFNILGLASWLLRGIVSRNDSHLKKSHVKMFDSIVPFLKRIEPKKGLPVGISLIAVAKKI